MDENQFRWHGLPREVELRRDPRDEAHAWRQLELQITQLISARAPLPDVLNRICWALDIHIGGIVSLISMPSDDPASAIEIVRNAAVCGLEIFHSEDITASSGEDLGHIEMYSCVPRIPSPAERLWIDRALHLAANAIQSAAAPASRASASIAQTFSVRGNVPRAQIFRN